VQLLQPVLQLLQRLEPFKKNEFEQLAQVALLVELQVAQPVRLQSWKQVPLAVPLVLLVVL